MYYKSLGDRAMQQVNDEQLFAQPGAESNSIAIIVQHMAGNMKSRFTDFLGSDGEKEWRNRDREFEAVLHSRTEVLTAWEEGWQVLFGTLSALHEEQLAEIVYIRNEGHTVLEALNRQLSHYPYHVGQIVLLAKMFAGSWQSLSIPRSGSAEYNAGKFDREKQRRHFTNDHEA